MKRQPNWKSFTIGGVLAACLASFAQSQVPTPQENASWQGSQLGPNSPSVLGVLDSTARHPTSLSHPSQGDSTQDPQHRVGAAGDFIGFSHADGSGSQTITLVDTRNTWMAVYHVSRSGEIQIRSSRDIAADFSLELNPTEPTSQQIRKMRP